VEHGTPFRWELGAELFCVWKEREEREREREKENE